MKQERRGQDTDFKKNDIAIGYDENWLESTRSKMAKYVISSRPWASPRALSVTLWTAACQAPLSMGFPKLEYWSRLPFPPLWELPDPGIKPTSPHWQVDSLLRNLGSHCNILTKWHTHQASWQFWGQPSNTKKWASPIPWFSASSQNE